MSLAWGQVNRMVLMVIAQPGSGLYLKHDPDGWACNMGWVVVDADGVEYYRGPEDPARFRAGRPFNKWPENLHWAREAEALGRMMLGE